MPGTLVATSTPVSGTTSAVPGAPSHQAGDSLAIFALSKPSALPPALPSGWTQTLGVALGVVSAEAVDAGAVYFSIFTRINVAGVITMPTITQDNTLGGATLTVSAASYRPGTGDTMTITATSGNDTTGDTSHQTTGAAVLGYTVDDLVTLLAGVSNDAGAFSAHALSATGATFGTITENYDVSNAGGNNLRFALFTGAVTGGTATAAPVFNATLAVSTGGGTGFLRVSSTGGAVSVNAGEDGHATLGIPHYRTATETNLSSVTGRSWSVVSGPAQAGQTIGTAVNLSWTPSALGSYVIRYSATHSGGTVTDDATVVVVEGGQNSSAMAEMGSF